MPRSNDFGAPQKQYRGIFYTRNQPDDDDGIVGEGDTFANEWAKKWQGKCTYHEFALERGEQGRLHFQGYMIFDPKRVRFDTIRKIDSVIRFGALISANASHKYISDVTDPTYVAGPWETGVRPEAKKQGARTDLRATDQVYAAAFAMDTVYEGIQHIKANRPKDYALHGAAIEANLRRAKVEPYKVKHSIDEYKLPKCDLSKSVLIYGESGCGKTQFAMSHFKNPMKPIRHMEQLKALSPDHDGIVFDDMSFKHFPPEAVIHLLDMEEDSEMHMRYSTVTIPAGLPRIFVHNDFNPFYEAAEVSSKQTTAIERRLNRVHVVERCYYNDEDSIGDLL